MIYSNIRLAISVADVNSEKSNWSFQFVSRICIYSRKVFIYRFFLYIDH